jgi:demethylmenaquinone methyltransferase/2-methoxy-6-polyprenyl-1,4-benzoquinol methylase
VTNYQIQPTASEIRDLFNRIAPVYDQLNNWFSLGQHQVWKQMTVKWSDPQAGDRFLDLCCGSGDLAQLVARKVGASGQVYGVDFSPGLLAIAQQRFQNQYPPLPISWVEANALDLPFEDNYFNGATMGYGLRNVIDIPRCLSELYRVLKPGAKGAILDFHRPEEALLRTVQKWYLANVVVPTADRFGFTEEYAYLSPSLDRFPRGPEQVILAEKVGFSATHYPIAFGTMGVLVVHKL